MSGRPDYDAGDLVAALPIGRTWPNGRPYRDEDYARWAPYVGRVFLVLDLFDDLEGDWLMFAKGLPCHVGAHAFREVNRLPNALTSLLVTEPVRDRVPA
jgi:hypothetical protein